MLLDLQPVFMELFCTPNGISELLGIQRKAAITHFNTTYQQLNMKIWLCIIGFLDSAHCLAFQRENNLSETTSIYILRYKVGEVPTELDRIH